MSKLKNNISFWHGEPELNDDANYKILDQYYMKFHYKAKYTGSYDENGIPQLNYQGDMNLDVVTNNIDFVYKVDCNSNGKGMLIYFDAIPRSLTSLGSTPSLGVNSIKILAYGNNYIEGETLKINRSERYQEKTVLRVRFSIAENVCTPL